MSPSVPKRASYQLTLFLLVVAGVSFAIAQTLVVPALPFFQREFDSSANGAAWIATGFLLSSSVLTPILGKLGDAYGKRRVLVASLAVFGIASLGGAFASSLEVLVGFRVLQGTGAAVFPLAFGIIRDEFPPAKVGFGIGLMSSVFGVGGGVGLLLSGVVLETLPWQWLFIIGAMPVLAAAAAIHVVVPESRSTTPGRTDWAGALTLSLALVALLVGVSQGNQWGWGSAAVLGLFALAAVMFGVWGAVERRVSHPMVDMEMFARPRMAGTNAATFFVGFAMFGAFILLPGFVQAPAGLPEELAGRLGYGFGASPVETGLFFLPSSIAMMVAGPIAGGAGTRYGPAAILRVGIGLMAVALALLAVAHDQPWTVYVWMTVQGIGISAALAAVGALVIANVRAEQTGVATGMNSIMRTVGAAFGSQVSAAIVAAHLIEGTSVPAESGYTIAFLVAAGAMLLAFLPTIALGRRGKVDAARPAARMPPAIAAGAHAALPAVGPEHTRRPDGEPVVVGRPTANRS